MTFRAKPVANKPRRQSRDSYSRRNTYINIGFGIAVVVAVVILVGVAGVLVLRRRTSRRRRRSAARRSPATTSRTRRRSRSGGSSSSRPGSRPAVAAGRLTSSQGQTQIQSLQQQAQTQSLAPTVLEKLIDGRIQADLAKEAGVSVTPDQIDAKIAEESTTPEQRHAWMHRRPAGGHTGKTDPTDEQKAAAKKIADQALADVTTGGKKWEDVAKAVSTDSSAAAGGDLGWIDKDAAEDPKWLDAVFAARRRTSRPP